MDGNGCKNTYPIFTHIFLSDRNENVNGGNERTDIYVSRKRTKPVRIILEMVGNR
jgi:hypothetical protein